MPISFYDICNNVRVRLGDPRAQAPNDLVVLNQACSQTRIIKRHRFVTGNPWDFNDLVIPVQPNIDTYQITQSDFGRAFAVITYDPTNPIWTPRPVRIYEPQNLFTDLLALPQSWAANAFIPWDGSWTTAQRIAFFWRDNVPYAQFWPVPLVQAGYLVRYEQNAEGTTTAALTSTPLPAEDADLVELRSAIAVLPISEWWDSSTKENRQANAEKRKDLAMTLANDERMAAQLFNIAVRQPSGPRTYPRWSSVTG